MKLLVPCSPFQKKTDPDAYLIFSYVVKDIPVFSFPVS